MQWIKCEEFDPSENGKYLVFDDRGRVRLFNWWGSESRVSHWRNEDDDIFPGEVIYWMPLPAAPSEKRGET